MSRASGWRLASIAAALLLLVIPVSVFLAGAGPVGFYFNGQYPPGQAAYLMMRPAGHIAFVLVFLQLLVGALGPGLRRLFNVPTLVPLHRSLGLVALGFVLLHPLLFAWARTLRADQFQILATLLPNPAENYWERMLFVGALAFYVVLFGGASALFGPRLAPRHWRWIHAVNYAGFLLAFWHSISIGTETRLFPVQALYWGMAAVSVLLVAGRILAGVKKGRAVRPATRASAPAVRPCVGDEPA